MKRNWLTLALVVSALALAVLPSFAGASFSLVKDGKPACSIIIAEKPDSGVVIAAKDLQTYVKKMTGALLEIRSDNENVSGPKALVGRSRLTDKISGLKIPDGLTPAFLEEGYVIHCTADTLVMAGNDSCYSDKARPSTPAPHSPALRKSMYFGTRYAVSDVLHRLGVRWFMPGEYGEVVPKTSMLELPAMSVEERPDFRVRSLGLSFKGDVLLDQNDRWLIHNRMNPLSADWFGVPADGSLVNMLPKEKIKQYPEWFALQPDGSRSSTMPCMTDEMRRNDPKYAGKPRLLDEIMKHIGERVQSGCRETDFSPDDGGPACQCEGCRQMSIRYTTGFCADPHGKELGSAGDPIPEYLSGNEYFYFVNGLLEATGQKYPGHILATNGYANRYVPPEMPIGFNRHQNLTVMFADINACTIHRYNDPKCWQSRQQYNLLKQWSKLSDKVWVYGYNYTMLVSKGTLTPMERRIRTNIPMAKNTGIIGFDDLDCADMALLGLPTYVVRMALEWDTEADVDAILGDFYSKWFGPAAAAMSDYYNTLGTAFDTAPYHAHEDPILSCIYTPTVMARCADDIARAEAAVVTDTDKLHVRQERLQFDHIRLYVESLQAKNELRFSDAVKLMQQMLSIKAEMNRISPFYGAPPYPYSIEWEVRRMKRLAEKEILAPLPLTTRFRTDKDDLGRSDRWMEADYDDSKWQMCNTSIGWQNQKLKDGDGLSTMSKDGHAYKGYAWYRCTVDLPALPQGKQAHIFCPALTNQAWVFVNGGYAGRNDYLQGWFRPQELDVDITSLLKPGKNVIALRVLGLEEYFGANGLYERPFIYAANSQSQLD